MSYCIYDLDFDHDGYPGEYIYGDELYTEDYYMGELWKPIKGFDRQYWVSNLARVWSVKSENFIKVKPMDDHGHLGVCLCYNGKRYYRYIHRLVAEAFIPNPENHPIVRHIDDDPFVNEPEYLRWGTQKDNIHDCIRNGKQYVLSKEDRDKGNAERKTPLVAINIATEQRLYFDSQGEASRSLRIPQANIWKVLNNQRSSAGGYIFKYISGGDYDGNY